MKEFNNAGKSGKSQHSPLGDGGVTSPQPAVATANHNVPARNQHLPIKDGLSRNQVQPFIDSCTKHDIELYGMGHPFEGIVPVIGPELGITQRGITIFCGDSHTWKNNYFALAAT